MFDLRKYKLFVDLAAAVNLGLVAFFGFNSELVTVAVLGAFVYVHYEDLVTAAKSVLDKVK